MRKNFGPKSMSFPLPVLIVGTYDENNVPNIMTAAWGGIYDTNMFYLCLSDDHKTTANIRLKKAFTISFGTEDTAKICDYVGMVSANDIPNKVELTKIDSYKSSFVEAPLFVKFPVALECVLDHFNEDGIVVAKIININADENTIDANGNIDINKFKPIIYNSFNNSYVSLGKEVQKAFITEKI